MKIYIAGKISGDKDYEKRFARAEKRLVRKGHSVLNPGRIGDFPEITYDNYISISRAMQAVCDAVYFLPTWLDSRGAKNEYRFARLHGQQLFFRMKNVPDCRKDRRHDR